MAEANEINIYFMIYFIGYDVSFAAEANTLFNVISIIDRYIYYFGNTRLSGPPITSKGCRKCNIYT